MLFFGSLGWWLVALTLVVLIPRSTVVVAAVAVPMGMGWVTWGSMDAYTFSLNHGLGLAVGGLAALLDLRILWRKVRRIQWRVLAYMARGGTIILDEVIEPENELDDEPADARA